MKFRTSPMADGYRLSILSFNCALMLKLVKSFDMFAALPLLRSKGESEVSNTFGGCCSVLILIFFTTSFIISLVNIVTYQSISSQLTVNEGAMDLKIKGLMFAFGISYSNMLDLVPIFQLTVQVKQYRDQVLETIVIPMVPCTLEMWSKVQESEKKFRRYRINEKLCPNDSNNEIEIYGGLTNIQINQLKLTLTPCDNATSSVTCASTDVIDNVLSLYLNALRYIIADCYILGTALNPNEKDSIYYYIDETLFWLPFTETRGTEALLKMGQFQIVTDQSFFPWNNSKHETGYFIDSVQALGYERGNYSEFVEIYIISGTKLKIIEREYGKIDDILAYYGGLFGLVMSFFSFFMISFNEYRYELGVIEGSQTSHSQAGQINEMPSSQINFLQYIKYSFYDWVKTLCCGYELQWRDCIGFDELREEANSQMDVRSLLKRIDQLEYCHHNGMSEEEESIRALLQPTSLSKMKKKRTIFEYADKILQKKASLTIKSIQLIGITIRNVHHETLKNLNQQKVGSRAQLDHEFKERNNFNDQKQMKGNESFDSPSIQLVYKYLAEYEDYIDQFLESLPDLEEEDLLIEQELAANLMRIPESSRIPLIKSIPLPILSRLMKRNLEHCQSRTNKNDSLGLFNSLVKVHPFQQ